MLPRQPLRFLLADDPGAGKTIMAGLLIKEMIARGDLQRCLVVCPGSLAEQWQEELYRRFQLPFDILTNDKLEAARTGNWFLETNLAIARLDKLSRNEDVQDKLKAPDCRWDLIVCDEAHKLSATFFGGEVKYTKRYKLGQMLSTLTRHLAVRPEVARKQQNAEAQPAPDGSKRHPSGAQPTLEGSSPLPDPKTSSTPRAPTRFHGTVPLNPVRASRDVGSIVDGVISLLGAAGTVRVTLEIEAEIPSGASEKLVRDVTENTRTLKFTSAGFEKE
jgi:hypothetical protein